MPKKIWPKARGEGVGKALVAGTLKKELFFAASLCEAWGKSTALYTGWLTKTIQSIEHDGTPQGQFVYQAEKNSTFYPY